MDISSATVNADLNIDEYGDIIPQEQTKNFLDISPDKEEEKKTKKKIEQIKKDIEKRALFL